MIEMRNLSIGVMFVAGAAVVAAAVALIARPPDVPQVVQQVGTPTPTTTPGPTDGLSAETIATLTASYRSILSAQDAISRTILELPMEQHPRDAIARKLRETTFWIWYEQYTTARGVKSTVDGIDPDSVVWLVAVRVDGLSTEHFSILSAEDLISMDPNASAAATAVTGSFASRPLASAVLYVWDASTGTEITSGVLSDSIADGYGSILQMTDEAVVIPTPYLRLGEAPRVLPTVEPQYAMP